MFKQTQNVVIDVKYWPVKPGPASDDFDFRQLRWVGAFEPLQLLSRNRNLQTVVEIEANQILFRLILGPNYSGILRLELPGARHGGIYLSD